MKSVCTEILQRLRTKKKTVIDHENDLTETQDLFRKIPVSVISIDGIQAWQHCSMANGKASAGFRGWFR